MKTYPVLAEDGQQIAFEIENAFIGVGTIAKLFKSAKGISHVIKSGTFLSTNDVRLEFSYFNVQYVVWEPYGDNSRYWVGPKDPNVQGVGISEIEDIFKKYDPPLMRKLFGNILLLRLSSIIKDMNI